MSCYRSILVALDGSADAEAALDHAVALARDQNARLTLLTVQAPVPAVPGALSPPPGDAVHLRVLHEAADSVPADLGVTTLFRKGPPAAVILAVARERGHDLVVMGSHGHGRAFRAMLGSTSEQVLRHAELPVMQVRSGSPSQD
jgi:nucleotide-binding universal stress UspA family protein